MLSRKIICQQVIQWRINLLTNYSVEKYCDKLEKEIVMMRGLDPTPKEREIIYELLIEHGITDDYEVAPSNFEGKKLPGSTYDGEIMSQQGYIVTSSKAYYYWLDWYNGHYTLGHEEGTWEEIDDIDEHPDWKPLSKIRVHLLQRLQNTSSDEKKA